MGSGWLILLCHDQLATLAVRIIFVALVLAMWVLKAFAHHHEKLMWHCRLALLMPDHLHAILAFPRESRPEETDR